MRLERRGYSQDKLHSCPAVSELRKSLEAEREAVFNFLFTAVDDTLTPAQEAFLDIQSYPFCPDIWELTNLLAQRRKVGPAQPSARIILYTACAAAASPGPWLRDAGLLDPQVLIFKSCLTFKLLE